MISSALLFFGSLGESCGLSKTSAFLGFPTWYKYLSGIQTLSNPSDSKSALVCTPQLTNLNDIWLIVAAAIEILLRVAALVAVGFIIFGGVEYLTSQGEPDQTNRARQTLINAAIGLAIAVLAAVIVNFIAGSIK